MPFCNTIVSLNLIGKHLVTHAISHTFEQNDNIHKDILYIYNILTSANTSTGDYDALNKWIRMAKPPTEADRERLNEIFPNLGNIKAFPLIEKIHNTRFLSFQMRLKTLIQLKGNLYNFSFCAFF